MVSENLILKIRWMYLSSATHMNALMAVSEEICDRLPLTGSANPTPTASFFCCAPEQEVLEST